MNTATEAETDEIIRIIEAARIAAGWTRRTLCIRAGVHPTSYGNYISGRTSPSLAIVRDLITTLGLPGVVIHSKQKEEE